MIRLADLVTAAAQSGVLWTLVVLGWLALERLERRAAARRQLDTYRARVWR